MDMDEELERKEGLETETETESQGPAKPEPDTVEMDEDGGAVVRPSRAERRKMGPRERREAAIQRGEAERAALLVENQRLMAVLQGSQSGRQRPDDMEQFRSRMDEIGNKKLQIQKMIQSEVNSEEDVKRLASEWRTLDWEAEQARLEHVERRVAARIPRQQDPVGAATAMQLSREYPEAARDVRAVTLAQAIAQQKIVEANISGRPVDSYQLQADALREAAARLGIGSRSPMSDGVKARFAGGMAPHAPRTGADVRLTGQQVAMALATYPDIDEKTAIAKWRRAMEAE